MIMCVKRIDFEDQSNSVALSSQRPGQSELRNPDAGQVLRLTCSSKSTWVGEPNYPDAGPNFAADQIWIV